MKDLWTDEDLLIVGFQSSHLSVQSRVWARKDSYSRLNFGLLTPAVLWFSFLMSDRITFLKKERKENPMSEASSKRCFLESLVAILLEFIDKDLVTLGENPALK